MKDETDTSILSQSSFLCQLLFNDLEEFEFFKNAHKTLSLLSLTSCQASYHWPQGRHKNFEQTENKES